MATLKIYSEIAPEECLTFLGVKGVSFDTVEEFIQSIDDEDDVIDIRLHCAGGSVVEGWAIVDALRATGKRIVATIEGQCASMASVVLLAASERKGYQHATLLIHDPYYPEGALWEAQGIDDLEKHAEQLRADREKIIDFYVERTGTDRAVIEEQMARDEMISMERAKELGFINEIVAPRSASARKKDVSNLKTKKQIEMADKTTKAKSDKKSLLAKIIALFDDEGPVNYELETASGEKITVEKPEGEDPAVGDRAYPDGEHKMPDGSTIVIEDETIVQIIVPEESGDEELEAAKAEIERLNDVIATLNADLSKAQAVAKTEEDIQILDAVKAAGGMRALARISSQFQPQARKSDFEPVAERTSKIAERVEKLKANFVK